MARINRIALIALGFIATLAAVAAPMILDWRQSAGADRRAEQQSRSAIQIIQSRCVELSDSAQVACLGEAIRSAQDVYRDERDLNAQQVMALWARVLGLVGIVTVPLSVLGVWLLLATLKETRRIGEAQIRAYLSVTQATLTLPALSEIDERIQHQHSIVPNFSFEISNAGNSPARKIRYAIHCSFRPMVAHGKMGTLGTHRVHARSDMKKLWDKGCGHIDAISPGTSLPLGPIGYGSLTEEEVSVARLVDTGGMLIVELLVQIDYHDAFDSRQEDEWAFSCQVSAGMLGSPQEMSPQRAAWFGAKFIDANGKPHFDGSE